KGEKGTVIQYWKFSDERPKTDPDTGKLVLDENGKAVKEKVTLATPRMFMATVFNAAQVDNMPALEVSEQPQVQWDSIERAESILAKSGARIIHQESNRAFYSPGLDSIHIPSKTQFETAANYY